MLTHFSWIQVGSVVWSTPGLLRPSHGRLHSQFTVTLPKTGNPAAPPPTCEPLTETHTTQSVLSDGKAFSRNYIILKRQFVGGSLQTIFIWWMGRWFWTLPVSPFLFFFSAVVNVNYTPWTWHTQLVRLLASEHVCVCLLWDATELTVRLKQVELLKISGCDPRSFHQKDTGDKSWDDFQL